MNLKKLPLVFTHYWVLILNKSKRKYSFDLYRRSPFVITSLVPKLSLQLSLLWHMSASASGHSKPTHTNLKKLPNSLTLKWALIILNYINIKQSLKKLPLVFTHYWVLILNYLKIKKV
jgi:hypothetical protein